MKKEILLGMIAAMMLVMSLAVSAAAPNWDITGTWTWVQYDCVGCTTSATHTMTITAFDVCTGDFSGTGVQVGDATNTWTVEGNVDGNAIDFILSCNPESHYAGYILDAAGTVTETTMSGSGADNYARTTPWNAYGVTAEAIDTTDADSDGTIDICDDDDDNDGVLDVNDFCAGTIADTPDVSFGVNRHIWRSGAYFTTLVPGTKGAKVEKQSLFSIADTKGCSCEQILQKIKDATGAQMNGHWKYGCSKSVMEEWILDMSDGVFDGMYLLDTVTVPANKDTNTLSSEDLVAGQEYVLKTYGTACAEMNSPPACTINFDAEYAKNVNGATGLWADGVEGYEIYGTDLLDLMVGGNFVNWGAYNSAHEYSYSLTPSTSGQLALKIYDIYYPNNAGNLFVDIYAVI